MLVVAFTYFIILTVDIRRHITKAKAVMKERERRQELFEEQLYRMELQRQLEIEKGENPLDMANGTVQSIPVPEWNAEPVQSLSHRYCFQTGRHGNLFYLKLGAAWFCFGLLIHSILVISYQVIFLMGNDTNFVECASVSTLILDILFPLYSIFVLFFIFKYANVIIMQGRGLARFFLMHAIGTSLAFWIYTIVRETVDAIRLKDMYKAEAAYSFESFLRNVTISKMTLLDEAGGIIECPGPETLNSIYRTFSPYLYPFVIEFCILIGE